jgi:3-dehydroquinate dehydratase
MSKATPKKTAKKLAVKKQTVSVLTDRSIVANLKNTKRPIIIISMGCGSDFTRQIPTDFRKLLATDIT